MARRISLGPLFAHVCVLYMAVAGQGQAVGGSRKLQQSKQSVLKGEAIVMSFTGGTGSRSRSRSVIALKTPQGARVELQLTEGAGLEGITTGTPVEAVGAWQAPGTGGSASVGAALSSSSQKPQFRATAIRVSGSSLKAGQKLASGGGGSGGGSAVSAAARSGAGGDIAAAASTTVLSSNQLAAAELPLLVIPIAAVDGAGNSCPGTTGIPTVSVEAIKATLFAENNPTRVTVGSTFGTCSYNRTRVTAKNSRVTGLVTLPCSGTSPSGESWSFDTCSFQGYHAWSEAAEAVVRGRGVPVNSFKYRIYLLPPGACGGAIGFAYIGCSETSKCRVWIGGEHWEQPIAIAHELGHSIFMEHSASIVDGQFNEYGDESGLMGYCCAPRCWNTPHAWQAGWLTVQQLDGNSLKLGTTITVPLASQSLSSRTGLRILPSWAAGADPLFVGYRAAGGGDIDLDSLANKVHLYTSKSTHTYDAQKSLWRGSLSSGSESWVDKQTGLVVRLRQGTNLRSGPAAAVVSVCRRGGAETAATCAAGIDNDCNGLAGANDPACSRIKARPARP